ncbi:MAG: VOC family protein [Mycobacterium sp.]
MPNQLHHVIIRSHSSAEFIRFLTDVVGMTLLHTFRVPGELLVTTMDWPPNDGAEVSILGNGEAGMIEILDVPEELRPTVPEGLAAMSFLTDDYTKVQQDAHAFATDVTPFEALMPGVELFKCTVGGVLIEFMGSYAADEANQVGEHTASAS